MDNVKVYHVNPKDSKWWKGEEEGKGGSLMEAMDREVIIRRMEEKAKLSRPSKLIVHSQDGKVEFEENFDDNPSKMGSMEDSLMSD